jgi:hypothetical protein
LDKDKRSGEKGGAFSKRQARHRAPEGLEIEAGFKIWLAFLRHHLGNSYAWDRNFANDLERVESIDEETALLLKIAVEWSAEDFYSARTRANPDFTKGSEHFVTRYFEGSSPRVVKATIPGKYGRHEYSPSIYLNSWRLFQQFVPALNIRVHGVLVQPTADPQKPLPSLVTSMQYIEGGHPRAQQIRKYMETRGWVEFTDQSETQDYLHEVSRQVIRDAHPGNWIKKTGTAELIPIDISIEQRR